ncbi:hypothetical protein E0H26_03830 [Micromonospora zingiberis]|uniref:Uncharacterized protein n=1 Tax=Micromonospora zingiberis TaxID=2053011 RepID=A0A4R0GQ47_9ACTN|nr:hypothetical protein [Micromonospora zingiberis]TCB99696.1 hypothetical protein E0H26_03830 [Micromonospora zingiberis]
MSQPVAGGSPEAPRPAAATSGTGYSATEWDLIIGLPAQVIVIATQPGPGRPYPGMAAGLAGLDAMAAGRAFDSDLVRSVVAAIYARHDGTAEPQPRPGDLVDVLAACRAAVRVLDRRADPADSAAYRQWVQSVAARVCRTGSAVLPDGTLAPADRRLLDRLGGALALG